jgi:hypothetical protein
MNFKKKLILITMSALLSDYAIAESNIDVVTTISVGPMNIQVDIDETFTSNNGAPFDKDYRNITTSANTPATEIGVTILDDNLYYGLSMLITGQTVARLDVNTFDNNDIGNEFKSESTQQVVSKSSYSLYSGYSFTDNYSFYGGLTFSSSGFGDRVFIDEFGPYVGGRYTLKYSPTILLNFDLSLSVVNTEITLDDKISSVDHTIKSTTGSYSLSTTWLKALDRGRSFFIRLKIANLKIEGSETVKNNIGTTTGTATISGNKLETSINLGMGF